MLSSSLLYGRKVAIIVTTVWWRMIEVEQAIEILGGRKYAGD